MLDTLNIILILGAIVLGVLYFSIRGSRKNRERRMASKR